MGGKINRRRTGGCQDFLEYRILVSKNTHLHKYSINVVVTERKNMLKLSNYYSNLEIISI